LNAVWRIPREPGMLAAVLAIDSTHERHRLAAHI
jgi:hypothetical protein